LFPRVILVSILLLVSACISPAPQGPVTDFKPGHDFASMRRIALAEHQPSATVIETLGEDVSPIFDVEFRAELAERGFTVVEQAADADLVLSWELEIQEKMDMRTYDVLSYFRCWRCGPSHNDVSMEDYVEGKLVVYLQDPLSGENLWRSIMHERLDLESATADPEQRIRGACRQALAGFPPP
jgi:hypothetical protein